MRTVLALSLALGLLALTRPARAVERAPYHANLAELARENANYRRVLYTGQKTQLVLMSIPPGGDIGQESHGRVEQTIVNVSGQGRLIVNGVPSDFGPGDVVVVPPHTLHNIRNIGTEPLKLYTIYAPPNHLDQRIQPTKAAAEADRADEAFSERVEHGR